MVFFDMAFFTLVFFTSGFFAPGFFDGGFCALTWVVTIAVAAAPAIGVADYSMSICFARSSRGSSAKEAQQPKTYDELSCSLVQLGTRAGCDPSMAVSRTCFALNFIC